MKINNIFYISAAQLSRETGYTPNAIRLKRKNTNWGLPEISQKRSRKLVEFNIFGYNQWCANQSKLINSISTDIIQFVLFKKFKSLYGVSIIELSHFCDYIGIEFVSLVILAPDGNKMINLDLYRKNIYSLLKFLKVI